MPLSRVRLRLASWFALAFLVGLLVLSLSLYTYYHHRRNQAFTAQLATEALGLAAAVRRELIEAPSAGLRSAAEAAVEEWPAGTDALVVYDSSGARLASAGPAGLAAIAPDSLLPGQVPGGDVGGHGEHRIRLVTRSSSPPFLTVTAAGSLAYLDEDAEALALWLWISAPLTLLLSLVAGYSLSRRALHPVAELEGRIAEIAPDDLQHRLPVSRVPDEVDRVAVQFNSLLDRLQQSRDRNRRFLEQAAHQIRTPLTLVLGETDLALGQPRTPEAREDALRRVRLAAIQMQRRVEELFLLARAEAGERPPLAEAVELDGLAFESADRMRARAKLQGQRLELGRIDPIVIRASEELLREAVIELLENACRHGARSEPIRLQVEGRGRHAAIVVTNAVAADPSPADGMPGHGLGLQLVSWIAAEHGGRLEQHEAGGRITLVLLLPLGALEDGEERP